jgi:hypothetical protein
MIQSIQSSPNDLQQNGSSLKRKSFVKFSEEVKDTPTASRLRKVLSKDHTNGLGTLLQADRLSTEYQKETLETPMMIHFPESLRADGLRTEDQ